MRTLPLDQIHISPNRQRREFDLKSLNELGESIRTNGLFHPVVVRWEGTYTFEPGDGSFSPGSKGAWCLVSGERRLRAIKDIYELGGHLRHGTEEIPVGQVPVVSLGELDELAREEAELDENIRRLDLTWQERAAATERLTHLRHRQASQKGEPAPTTAAIALEVRGSSEGINQETTRREIVVAKHLSDPEVRAAKSVDEAFKILRRKEDVQRRADLAVTVGRTYSASEYLQALNEDALSWMVAAAGDQFDVICTDPPYGIDADEFGDAGGRAEGAHFYEDSYKNWKSIANCLAFEGFRIARSQAHLYAFCDITHFEEFKQLLSAAGWHPFRTPLVWHKPNGSRAPWPDQGPQRKYELILYANKGRKPVTRLYPDVLTYPADENLGHHAQKPVALFEDLLRRSCSPGDRVLDPFAGSGPIFPAAHALKTRATGIEKDGAAYAICVGRLDALKEKE